ncbi:MAG: MATE family efflux transporter [Ruminococcaceae bacterium]|nr:MATE family efflux transporter [Oscillospiraceae bacterium]
MDLLKDNPRKLFWKFLVPAVSAAIAVAAYSFVDTIVIGQDAGPNGTAACAVVLPIFSIAHFLALLCGVGGSVLMSKARGEGNREKGDAYYTASMLYVGIITLLLWILGVVFQIPLYRLFGADDVLLPYAYDYGKWIFGAFPSFVLVSFLGCFIRTDGSPKFVMTVTLIGGVINVIGDIVLVFPLGMGMAGAAIATVAGSVVQSILLIGYILVGKTSLKLAKPFKWLTAVKKISILGFGAGLPQIAMTVVTYIINNQIMKYSGAAALAVYGLLCTIAALFLSVFEGIGHAAQPIVSANFGAGQRDRYHIIAKIGMRTAVVFGVISFALCALFPSEIIKLFMKVTPEVAEIAPYIIRVYTTSFFPMAINMFVTAYLQSVTKATSATVVSLLRGLILSSILLYVLPLFMESNGIWWAVTIAEALAAVVAVFCMMPELKSKKVKER